MRRSILTHAAVLFIGVSLGSTSLALAGGTSGTSGAKPAVANPHKCRYDGPSYSSSLADHVACLEQVVFERQQQLGFGKHLLGSLVDGRNTVAAMCEWLYQADLSGDPQGGTGLQGAFWNVRQIDCPTLIARGPG